MKLDAVLAEATQRPWSVRPTGVLANEKGNVRFIAEMNAHGGAAGVFDGQDGLDQDLLCHAVNTFEVLYAALLKAQLALDPRSEQIDTENALREIRDARALVEDVPLQGRR